MRLGKARAEIGYRVKPLEAEVEAAAADATAAGDRSRQRAGRRGRGGGGDDGGGAPASRSWTPGVGGPGLAVRSRRRAAAARSLATSTLAGRTAPEGVHAEARRDRAVHGPPRRGRGPRRAFAVRTPTCRPGSARPADRLAERPASSEALQPGAAAALNRLGRGASSASWKLLEGLDKARDSATWECGRGDRVHHQSTSSTCSISQMQGGVAMASRRPAQPVVVRPSVVDQVAAQPAIVTAQSPSSVPRPDPHPP